MTTGTPQAATGGAAQILRDAFTRHLGYKALALLIALVFFYTRETESVSNRTLSIAVIAMLDPGEAQILVSDFPEQVTLKLQGPVSVLKDLRSQDVGPAVVSLEDIKDTEFRFNRNNFNLPEGVKIVKIYPDSVPVKFEDRASKEIPIVPDLQGKVLPGRYLGEAITIKPEKVVVTGARSAVERIQRWETEPLYVDDLEPGLHEIEVALAAPKIANVYPEKDTSAFVGLEVLQKFTEKWVRQIPVLLDEIPDTTGITVKPPTVSIYVKGPEEYVKTLDAESMNVYTTLSAEELAKTGSYLQKVSWAPPPEGVEFLKVQPPKVSVINHSPIALKNEQAGQ